MWFWQYVILDSLQEWWNRKNERERERRNTGIAIYQ